MQEPRLNIQRRICFVTDSLDGGGIGVVFLTLARAMMRLGCRVDMFVLRPPQRPMPKGVNVVVVGGKTRGAALKLARFLRRSNPDLVITARDYIGAMAVVSRALAGRRKTPLVWTFHTHHSLDFKHKPLGRRFIAWLAMKLSFAADHLVCVSRGVARDLEQGHRATQGRTRTIYNPVERPRVLATPAHPWCAPSQVPVVVICGRLVAQKGVDVAISAFARLRAHHQARMLILGDGPLLADLQDQIDQTGYAADIDCLGAVDAPADYMKDAACLVVSSHWEGFGMVIAEAMSVGCPVISTDCPSGPREVLGNGAYGTLVPVGDVAALAHAIATVLVTPPDTSEAMQSLARFDPDKIARAYLDLV